MSSRVVLLDEPRLEFRHGQFLEDPHDGLSLFGPYGIEVSSHPKNLTIGVIGTPEEFRLSNRWCKVVRGAVYPGDDLNIHLWPIFPGFEGAFCFRPASRSGLVLRVRFGKTETRIYTESPQQGARWGSRTISDCYQEDREEGRAVWRFGLVVPDFVWRNCRPESFVPGATGKGISRKERELRAGGQTDFF